MASFISLENALKITGPDGNVSFVSATQFNSVLMVKNAEASATILAGEAVKNNQAGSYYMRWDYAATDSPPAEVQAVTRVEATAGNNLVFLGVALQNIKAAAYGPIAGVGSVLCVRTSATPIAVNAECGGGASPSVGNVVVETTANRILGVVTKTNTVAPPGTGTTAAAGVYIRPR